MPEQACCDECKLLVRLTLDLLTTSAACCAWLRSPEGAAYPKLVRVGTGTVNNLPEIPLEPYTAAKKGSQIQPLPLPCLSWFASMACLPCVASAAHLLCPAGIARGCSVQGTGQGRLPNSLAQVFGAGPGKVGHALGCHACALAAGIMHISSGEA